MFEMVVVDYGRGDWSGYVEGFLGRMEGFSEIRDFKIIVLGIRGDLWNFFINGRVGFERVEVGVLLGRSEEVRGWNFCYESVWNDSEV